MNPLRIAYITNIVAPFWCDVARAAEKQNLELTLLCGKRATVIGRPSHWEEWKTKESDYRQFVRLADKTLKGHEVENWFEKTLHEIQPDIVISSSYLPWAQVPASRYALQQDKPLGLWAEAPMPSRGLKKKAKRLEISRKLKRFDFCFAVGDSAVAEYESLMPSKNKTFLIPYGQDLDAFESARLSRSFSQRLRVLFSGQMVKRHNFTLIADAIEKLESLGERYKLSYIFSGNGPEKRVLETLLRKYPGLSKRLLFYDEPFCKFEDRSKPFVNADVFLYPSRYSGWGLVVPEAMAAGLPVISTRGVESAKYFIEHGRNGLFVEENASAIADALKKLADKPKLVESMRVSASRSSAKGAAASIVKIVKEVFLFLGYSSE